MEVIFYWKKLQAKMQKPPLQQVPSKGIGNLQRLVGLGMGEDQGYMNHSHG